MKNRTINQHFISQAEQRLNAINPNAKPKKQKIYAFNIIDRDEFKIELASDGGTKIANNLSDTDLYSFDLLSEGERKNFEILFGQYEYDIAKTTKTLLDKALEKNVDISTELQRIFVLKFMNSLRNPHCIKSTLNLFRRIIRCYPTDSEQHKKFSSIEVGNKPHVKILACKYSVTEKEYSDWLKILFLTLAVADKNSLNIVESIANKFFINPVNLVTVFLCIYSENVGVLLSDRGYSILDDNPSNVTFDFNLSSDSFVTYVFSDLNLAAPSVFGENSEYASKVVNLYSKLPPKINVKLLIDNQECLESYNSRVIFQANKNVYCKHKEVPVQSGL